jgi:hypothetical protein
MEGTTTHLDHLILGTPDLGATLESLSTRFGVRASAGGRHPDEGTCNALYQLDERTYLEIMGPDPSTPEPNRPRWMGIDTLTETRLVGWAVGTNALESLAARISALGLRVGPILHGGRTRPDGSLLSWRLTDPRATGPDSMLPFLIDWGESPHPAESATRGLKLLEFRIEHPDAERLGGAFDTFGLDVKLDAGPVPALRAVLDTPAGIVELT